MSLSSSAGMRGLSELACASAGNSADGSAFAGLVECEQQQAVCSVNSGHLCRQQAAPSQQRLFPKAAGDTSPPRWMAESEAGSSRDSVCILSHSVKRVSWSPHQNRVPPLLLVPLDAL